jgi:hypothetical protein
MVPSWRKRKLGGTHAYVCPVPGCGRLHDDEGYFDAVEAIPSAEDGTSKNPLTPPANPLTHINAA